MVSVASDNAGSVCRTVISVATVCYGVHFKPYQFSTMTGTPVELVMTFKLLGVHVGNDLKWTYIMSTQSCRKSRRVSTS